MNGFLQIQNEEIAEFVATRQDRVRSRVESRLATYELLGNVAELFFPKLADTVTVMLGGEISDPDTEYLTIEEGGWAGDDPPAGPGSPDEDAIR